MAASGTRWRNIGPLNVIIFLSQDVGIHCVVTVRCEIRWFDFASDQKEIKQPEMKKKIDCSRKKQSKIFPYMHLRLPAYSCDWNEFIGFFKFTSQFNLVPVLTTFFLLLDLTMSIQV